MSGFMKSVTTGVIDLEVWRTAGGGAYDRWGDIKDTKNGSSIPALAGREHVKTIENCVFEPRTTRRNNNDAGVDGTTTTAITVFLRDVTEDLKEGDYFVITAHNGRKEAWKLDGESSINNYVSPFTGIVGGRELFLTRVRSVK